jgi:hypothetical protein
MLGVALTAGAVAAAPVGPARVGALTELGASGSPRIEAVTVTGDRTLTVAWLGAASTEESPIGSYTVEASLDGGPLVAVGDGTCGADDGTVATRCRVSGLAAGAVYRFRVVATNGAASPVSGPAVAITPPGAVGAVTATPATYGSVSLAWTGPDAAPAAPVQSYAVEIAAGEGPFEAVPAGSGSCDSPVESPCRVDGLAAGTPYRFRIAAVNAAGVGPAAVTAAVAVPGTALSGPRR